MSSGRRGYRPLENGAAKNCATSVSKHRAASEPQSRSGSLARFLRESGTCVIIRRMASRPVMKKLKADIDKAGGEQFIFDQIVAGVPVRKIMEPFGVTRGMFYWWLRDGGEERAEGYRLAKEASAETHAEIAGLVLDDLAEKRDFSNAEVSLAGKRSDYHRYLARIRDREQFGDSDTAASLSINLSIGDAHLQALRELGKVSRPAEPKLIPTVSEEAAE